MPSPLPLNESITLDKRKIESRTKVVPIEGTSSDFYKKKVESNKQSSKHRKIIDIHTGQPVQTCVPFNTQLEEILQIQHNVEIIVESLEPIKEEIENEMISPSTILPKFELLNGISNNLKYSLEKGGIDSIFISELDQLLQSLNDINNFMDKVRTLKYYRAHLRSYGVYGTIVNDVNRKEHELLKQSDR